ncbi:hypothetical protein CCR96_23930 [Halochromatium roseum]|nr:hypothetical protein [Halochromatium roseum]
MLCRLIQNGSSGCQRNVEVKVLRKRLRNEMALSRVSCMMMASFRDRFMVAEMAAKVCCRSPVMTVLAAAFFRHPSSAHKEH